MFDSYTETTLEYYPERCINCRRCTQVCPHGVFSEGPERAELVHPEGCMECGACALNCPVQAIEVRSGVGCAWAMISAALRGKTWTAESAPAGVLKTPVAGTGRRSTLLAVRAVMKLPPVAREDKYHTSPLSLNHHSTLKY